MPSVRVPIRDLNCVHPADHVALPIAPRPLHPSHDVHQSVEGNLVQKPKVATKASDIVGGDNIDSMVHPHDYRYIGKAFSRTQN